MSDTKYPMPASNSQLGAYGRGILGALIMGLALGLAIAAGDIGELYFGWAEPTRQIVHAGLCSALAVPLIIGLRRNVDGKSLRGLGLPGLQKSLSTFSLGIASTLVAAILVFGIGTAIGWVRWNGVEWGTLAGFVITTALLIFFYEALPEELTLRGYTYRNLNARLSRGIAVVLTTVLFLAVPGMANVVRAVVAGIFGTDAPPPSLAPVGQNPVDYFVLLTVFSFVLLVARITTGSLWTGIGLHVMFLVINRAMLTTDHARVGIAVELTSPFAVALIPIYLVLAGITLNTLAEWQGRPIDWRARTPE